MIRDISEQVSYLQGLTEGLNINDSGPHGRVINGILEVLEQIAVDIRGLHGEVCEISECLDSIDEELCHLQDRFMEVHGDNDRIEIECSHCHEKLHFDADVLNDEETIEIICPRCNEVVFVNDGSFDYEPGCFDDDNLSVEEDQANLSPS